MSKVHFLTWSIVFLTFIYQINFVKARGDNGGIPCAACTILLSMSSQLAEIYNETTVESLSRICTYLPQAYQNECESLVGYLAPIIRHCLYFFYFVFNSTRWRYCQLQPRKFEANVKTMQIFSVKSLLRYLKSEIDKKNFIQYQVESKLFRLQFWTNAI